MSCAPPPILQSADIRLSPPELGWTAELSGCIFDANVQNTLFVYCYWKRRNYPTVSVVVTKKIALQAGGDILREHEHIQDD